VKVSLLILASSIIISCASQRQNIYFAASANDVEANPFLGFYESGNFVRTEPKWSGNPKIDIQRIGAAIAAFRAGMALKGFDRNGKHLDAVIESVHEPSFSLGDQLLTLRLPTAGTFTGGALFWTSNGKLKFLEPIVISLQASLDELLRRRAVLLWARALNDYLPEVNDHSIEIGSPSVQTLADARNIIAVYYPIVLKGPGGSDDRASAFFIYSLSDKKIVLETFGHPEWSPRAEKVVTIKPVVYFQLGNDKKFYFFAERSGAWEHFGYAIFDLRSGATLLESY
jgi:hypothetical protein